MQEPGVKIPPAWLLNRVKRVCTQEQTSVSRRPGLRSPLNQRNCLIIGGLIRQAPFFWVNVFFFTERKKSFRHIQQNRITDRKKDLKK